MTTMGKYRHLSQCSTRDGHFVILAIDHRANLRKALQYASNPLSDDQFSAFKQQVLWHLRKWISAVLTDPVYGFGPGIANQVILGQTGLISPIEVTDYDRHPARAPVQFIPRWSIARIKRVGGSGVKQLLYYHPEANDAAEKRDIVARIIETCAQYDIPYFLEPIAYSPDPQKSLDNAGLRQVMIEIARTFSRMGVDVLKLQFPLDVKLESDKVVWEEACKELDAACSVPWALLSAGVNYEIFAQQARIACAAGASGVMVGRAVWSEAVELRGGEREEFLATTAVERMQELAAICAEYALPWHERVAAPDAPINWIETYDDMADDSLLE